MVLLSAGALLSGKQARIECDQLVTLQSVCVLVWVSVTVGSSPGWSWSDSHCAAVHHCTGGSALT